MTYEAMAVDVLHLCAEQSLSNISLLGHSMFVANLLFLLLAYLMWLRRGGKVAMAMALSPSLPPDLIKNLIIADIAPSRGRLSPDFEVYLQAMHKIEDSRLKTRKDADQMLNVHVKVLPISL